MNCKEWVVCNHCSVAYDANNTSTMGKGPCGAGYCPYCGASTFCDSFSWVDIQKGDKKLPKIPKEGKFYSIW